MGVKTVWVLGSGFSRSLGGPQLDELLSPPTSAFVRALYADNHFIGHNGPGNNDVRHATEAVRRLYEPHGPSAEVGPRMWRLPEALPRQLDAAGDDEGGPEAKRLRSTLDALLANGGYRGIKLSNVSEAARRLVCAACCAFMKQPRIDQEHWDPYRDWARAITFSDAVITFNYDRVLETAGSFAIVLPGEPPGPTVTPVYKLHGSVDWKRERLGDGQDKSFRWSRERDREFALNCKGDEIGIATPGPNKRRVSELLRSVWDGALDRLREANVIVFVGYRFPPSDAEAREKLLGAIRENTSQHLELHVVLGPDRGVPDVVRLEQLLRYTVERTGRLEYVDSYKNEDPSYWERKFFRLSTHALFAEDFLTVWDRKLLWPHREPLEQESD